ncbi:major facilitator superfamily domain-containing protein [Halenospora varia]|nr:major facilitator superfamily domain-containing protein [Halenospora varia]
MTTQSSVKSTHSRNASLDKNLPEPPYHIFGLTKKRQMVWLLSFLSFLSAITSTIYFPVLNAFSVRFRTSTATALASVTIYMIPQALVPFFSIPTCQYFGRRATIISLLIVYFFANIGLALVDNVAGFMVLRVMQALGIGAVPALAVIVVEDLSIGQERSDLISELNTILVATQFLGPVLGGAFSQGFRFQSIFVFLVILSVIAIILVLVILPETLRSIAGNGAVQLPKSQLPLKDLRKPTSPPRLTRITTPLSKPYSKAIFAPFKGVFRLDIITTILFGSCVYAVLLSVIVTTATLLQTNFRLTAAETGAAFLPGVIGVVTACFLTNYLIPRDYEIVSRQYRIENYILDFKPIDPKKHLNFPIEQARLRNIRPFILTFIGVVGGYGFSTRRFLAISLLLQFFIAGSATGILRLNALLAEDLYPGEVSSINMVVNSARLLFAAFWVGIIQFIILGIQAKFAFLLLSMLVLLFSPLLFIQFRYGMKWRLDREASTRDAESVRTDKSASPRAADEQTRSPSFMVGGISKMEERTWNLKNRLRYMWERIVQEALEEQGRVKRWTRMK